MESAGPLAFATPLVVAAPIGVAALRTKTTALGRRICRSRSSSLHLSLPSSSKPLNPLPLRTFRLIPYFSTTENMRCFICSHCSNPSFIFGEGGTRKVAFEMGLKVGGEIPFEMEIRKGCDDGVVIVSAPESVVSKNIS
ncbi:hypothetical protein Dsin_001977 [Dipteronia sinensis]|uniref:Uncharacterized protein n=1 Tax=Dipteronia sinensis TaxID=43782 RepID=A0AAE0B4W5_9ROSI|nr:hypothetical protein Dsin_001977 [Dipteronia sinensis]